MSYREDSINKLPDALVSAIISLLPGTEGVRTSVLSHRWKSLWKYSSHLNFDQRQMLKPLIKEYLKGSTLKTRLTTALRRREGPQLENVMDPIHEAEKLINSILDNHHGPLSSCKIRHMVESCASGEALRWMRKLLHEKGARKLSMELEYPIYPPSLVNVGDKLGQGLTLDLPFEIFSGFEVLDLKNYSLKTTPSGDVPQILQTLVFNRISVSQDTLDAILNNCLSLQSLTLEDCRFRSVIKINSQNVKILKICRMSAPEIVVSSINLEEIVIDTVYTNPQNLIIEGPGLRILRAYYDLNNRSRYFTNTPLKAKEILEAFGGAQSPQGSSTANIFENLVTLCIDLNLKNVRNSVALSSAFGSFPHLQNLEINNKVKDDSRYRHCSVHDDDNDNEDICLPYSKHLFWQRRETCECINNQLKTLCIREYTGKALEVEFVKYIIMNAEAMKRITIWFVDDCTWEQAIQTFCLLSFPKASASLSITLKPGKEYLTKVDGSFEMWISTLKSS